MTLETDKNTFPTNQESLPSGGVRKLAAIMFTDIKDFSKKMQKNEMTTMQMLETHNRMMSETVKTYNGVVIKTVGDAFLVSFESVVNAAQCGIEVQQKFHQYNLAKSADEKITVRIGIHLGDIIVKDKDVFGDGVNIASRIQSMAEPGGVNISNSVYDQVKNKLDIHVINLGVPQLKNIAEAIKVYQVIIIPTDKVRGKFATQLYVTKTILKRKRTKRIIGVVSGILIIGGAVGYYYFSSTPPAAINSLAVVPLINASEPQNEYLADGITEDIISHLTRIPQLKVISKASSFHYKGKDIPQKKIAEELQVRYLLSGKLRVIGENVRIDADLTEPEHDVSVWSESYEYPRDKIINLQGEIANTIADKLHLTLKAKIVYAGGAMKDISAEAYDLYLKGLFHSNKLTKEDNALAISYFEQTAVKAPKFAAVYAALASSQILNNQWGWDLDERWINLAEESSRKALSIDTSLAEAYGVLGRIMLKRGKPADGLELLERSITLNPNFAASYNELGYEYLSIDPAKALTYLLHARELEPTDLIYAMNVGIGYAMLKDYKNTVLAFRQALKLDPQREEIWRNLGHAYERVFLYDSAVSAYKRSLEINPSEPLNYEYLSAVYLSQSKITQAESILTRGIQLADEKYRLLYILGTTYSIAQVKKSAESTWKEGLKLVEVYANDHPTLSEPHSYIGLFKARLGLGEEAVEAGMKAVELDTTDDEMMLNMARIFSILKQKPKMLEWFGRAKHKNPDYDDTYLVTEVDFQNYKNDPDLLAVARRKNM